MSEREQLTLQFENAARAVNVLLHGMAVPPGEVETASANVRLYMRLRRDAQAAYDRANDLWFTPEGRPTDDLARMREAARVMTATATTIKPMVINNGRTFRQSAAPGLAGRVLRMFEEWWDASPMGRARRLAQQYIEKMERAAARVLALAERAIDAAPPTAAAAGAGFGLVLLAAIVAGVWALSK